MVTAIIISVKPLSSGFDTSPGIRACGPSIRFRRSSSRRDFFSCGDHDGCVRGCSSWLRRGMKLFIRLWRTKLLVQCVCV
eukprot:3340832-Rhodomonas_salina.5